MNRRYLGFWALILVWFFVTLFGIGYSSWSSELSNAQKYIENNATQYANLVNVQLQLDQRTLALISNEISKKGLKSTQDINQELSNLKAFYHVDVAVAIINGTGHQLIHTGPHFSLQVLHTAQITEATKLAYQRIFRSDRFGIGPPLPATAYTGHIMTVELFPIPHSHRLWLVLAHPVVFAATPPDQSMYQGTAYSILRSDGLLQSRYPFPSATSYGQVQTGVAMQYIKAHPKMQMGILTGKVSADNQIRMTAFKAIRGESLFVGVSVPYHSIIAEWLSNYLPFVITSLVLLIMAILVFLLESKNLRKREQKATQLATRMQSLYQVLSIVGEVSQQELEEQQLFQLVCDTLVQEKVFSGAWIGAPDANHQFAFYAMAGHRMKEYLGNVNIRSDDSVAGQGPAGRAWRTGKYQVEDNWETSENMAYWLGSANATSGWKMSADFPIYREGHLYALLTVYHVEAFVFDEKLAQLGMRIVELISEILTNRDLASNLSQMETRYNLLLESMAEGVLGLDLNGAIIFSNASAEKMTGYSKEELINQDKHELMHHHYEDGADYPLSECLINQSLKERISAHYDHEVFWRKDGTYFPVEYTINPILDEYEQIVGAVLTFQDISVRRRAEEALQSTDEFRRALIENSPVGIFLASPERVIAQANKRVCEMFGYSLAELIGENFLLIHENQATYEAFGSKYQLLRESQSGLINLEFPFKKKDGTRLYCEVSGTPLDPEHLQKGIIWTLQDITERKMAEERLKESEEMLRTIYEVLPVGISITDPEGNLIDCNLEAEKLLGITSDEHNSRNFAGNEWMILREDGTLMPVSEYASVRALEEHQMIKDVEMEVMTPHGSTWLSVSAMPVENPKYGVTIAYEDVTTRKNTEREMLKLTRAVEYSPVSIVITNAAGDMEYINPRFTEVTGYTLDEVVGKNPRILKSGRVPHHVYETLWRTIKEGNTWRGELLNKKKNGELFWEMVRISPVTDPAGRITNFVAVKEDITAQKFTEEKLREAKEIAESANRVKGEFLANMSHEIRTPMNAILGLTQLLKNTELTPKQADYLEKIYTSSDALLKLLNDILDYSKIDAGRMEMEKSPFLIDEVLQMVLKLFSARMEEKGLQAVLDIQPGVPRQVNGDSLRLTQVLNNLVGNAIKFTDQGSIRIRVKADKQPDKGWLLHFTVSDTGIGIPKDKQAHLFQAFTQADSSISRKYGGTGLGLAISHQLVQLMGGTISVTSQPGIGSDFHFTIRVDAFDNLDESDEQSASVANESTSQREIAAAKVNMDGWESLGEGDAALLQSLFKDLYAYLKEQEIIPEAMMENLVVWSKKGLYADKFHRLLNQMDQFDHPGAKKTLMELAKALSIEWEDN